MSFPLASQLDTAVLICLKSSIAIQRDMTEIWNEKIQSNFDEITSNRKQGS